MSGLHSSCFHSSHCLLTQAVGVRIYSPLRDPPVNSHSSFKSAQMSSSGPVLRLHLTILFKITPPTSYPLPAHPPNPSLCCSLSSIPWNLHLTKTAAFGLSHPLLECKLHKGRVFVFLFTDNFQLCTTVPGV